MVLEYLKQVSKFKKRLTIFTSVFSDVYFSKVKTLILLDNWVMSLEQISQCGNSLIPTHSFIHE